MANKTEPKKFRLKQASIIFIFILGVILVFTAIDYFVHSLSPDYAVPSWYFGNKIIFGTIIGFIAFLFVKNKPILTKTLVVSAAIAILLQIRYYLLNYPLNFVLLFLVIHFVILLVVTYLGLRITKL